MAIEATREFRILGPLEVLVDGEAAPLGGQRRRALLARLLLDANRPVPADRLIEDLWGERARATTANALQAAISSLRSALDPHRDGVLTHAPGGYVLRVRPGELDTDRFAASTADGRRHLDAGDPDAAIAAFDAALALRRGLPLADLAGEPCAEPEIERLAEAFHAATEDRIDALLAAGRHAEAVPELERLVREEPLRERRWAQLMLALYRSGRQSDALRTYTSVRQLLAEELGVDPSPALRELEQAILEHRPELDLRPAAPTSPRARTAAGTTTVVALAGAGVAVDVPAGGRVTDGDPAGGAVVVAFDTAAGAVRFAVDTITRQPGARAGVDVADADIVQVAIDRAGALRQAAEPGEVLVSTAVRFLVESRSEQRFGRVRTLALDGVAAQEGHPVLPPESGGERVGGPAAVARRPRHPAPLVATDEYVGREEELTAARAAWRRARNGERVVVALTGEPGAGKTRFCAELSRVAAGAGALVAYGRGEPDGVGQPVARAVGHLLDGLDDLELLAAVGGLAADLAAAVPEAAVRIPAARAERPAEPQLQRQRVDEAVARVVAAAGRAAPAFIVLDDLHWADGATAGTLRHVASAEGPALIVAAYRDTDVDAGSAVVAALVDLRRLGRVVDIHLAGLELDEVGRCVQARAGRACTPEVARAVHQRTGGNPLLVEELARALGAAGGLDVEPSAVGRVDVPVAVRDLVAQRLPSLGATAADLLEAAAVAGTAFDGDVLPPMTDRSAGEVVDALDRAVAGGMLVEVRGTAGRYAFAHDLVRQALYDGLGAARRRTLHRRAAAALSTVSTAGAAEIAHHLVRGATSSTAHEAAMAAVVAAEDAVGRVAYEEAARWYAEALDVLGSAAPDAQRTLLLLGRGEALAAAGDRAAATDALHRAGEAARRAGDPTAVARVALARSGPSMGSWVPYGGDDPELTALLDEAAGSLGAEHDALRARVLACRAASRSVADPDGARRDANLAAALAESTGDPLAVRSALFGTHLAARGPGEVHRRLELTDRLLAMADEANQPTDALDAMQLRLADLVELGRLHDADALIARIESVGERARNVIAAWNVRRYRAMRAAIAARFDDAEALAAAALEVGRQVQPANAGGSYGALITVSKLLQGELAGFADAVAELAVANPGVSSYRAFECLFRAYEGEIARAGDGVRAALAAGIPADNNWLTTHTALAVACHRAGDAESAVALRDALAPVAGLHAAAGSWVASLGPVDRALALLHDVLGDTEAADRHAAAAEGWCRQVGAWAYLAVVRYEHAVRLQRRGAPGAGPALAEARATAVDVGVGLVLKELEQGGP